MAPAPIRTPIVALAGGVGGARFAQGLAGIVDPGNLTVIVNTGDDFDLYGLRISPDLDTVMYTLGGIADPTNGWGIAGDTRATLDGIAAYGEEPWFQLGDRDFATHILRTQWLREGESLSTVTSRLATGLGVGPLLIPMSDDPVATRIRSGDRLLDFQQYFVANRQQDVVDGVVLDGIGRAVAAPGVIPAIQAAEVIVFCPSNPIVSIGPILAVAGIREAISGSSAARVAISPIVGGKAVKGPADRMLTSLGHDASAVGVARMYQDLLDAMVIDEVDRHLAPEIESLGLRVMVAQTIMGGREDRERLAGEILDTVLPLRSPV
ncbi:MAG TPA: 2-phospho-L-lactate transferase [Thermomicrobiales bacterium]|nr:2-phospho-L-lactate transferase [Thermomicrobiales bacterium]